MLYVAVHVSVTCSMHLQTHDATCYSTFEFLNIPMDYYYCTVAVYYRYFDDDYNLLQSPDTKEACAYNSKAIYFKF